MEKLRLKCMVSVFKNSPKKLYGTLISCLEVLLIVIVFAILATGEFQNKNEIE